VTLATHDLLRGAQRPGGDLLLPGHRSALVVRGLRIEAGELAAVRVHVAPQVLTSLTDRGSAVVAWRSADGSVTVGWDGAGRPMVEVSDGFHTARLTDPRPLTAGVFATVTVSCQHDTLTLQVDAHEPVRGAGPSRLPIPGDEGIWLGSRPDSPLVEGIFAAEAAAGVLREATLWAEPPPAAIPATATADPLAWLGSVATDDDERAPRFHFRPPGGWMNEPHAPFEADGYHHLFFQANRRGPFWGGIEWGHAVSRDLVHWEHQPPALTPEPGSVAPTGVWSGSAVLDESGTPLLFVTAGDAGRHPDQAVALAQPAKGGWTLDARPLVTMPHDPDLVTDQFRDPFVWREAGQWFMLVGAGVTGLGGTTLLYRSQDGRDWQPAGRLHAADRGRHPGVGEMWELPVLLPVRTPDGRQRHVLLVCPWWARVPDGQIVEVLHWVGTWSPDSCSFVPDHEEPRRFDYGRHFTGPSGYGTSDGRTVLWSIAQDGRSATERLRTGWAHHAGLPLQLGLDDSGRLTVAPVSELATLRQALVGESTPDDGWTVTLASGLAQVEVTVETALTGTGELTLEVAGDAGTEALVRVSAERLVLERPLAPAYDVWHPATCDVGPPPGSGERTVRLFLDGALLELYVDDRTSLTTRLPPTGPPPTLVLRSSAGAHVIRWRAWHLALKTPFTRPTQGHP